MPKLRSNQDVLQQMMDNKLWYIQTVEYYLALTEMSYQTMKDMEEPNAFNSVKEANQKELYTHCRILPL